MEITTWLSKEVKLEFTPILGDNKKQANGKE